MQRFATRQESTEKSEDEESYYANDYMYEREEEEVEGSESPEAAITEPLSRVPAAGFSQERLAAAAAALAFRPRRPRRRSVPIDPADI